MAACQHSYCTLSDQLAMRHQAHVRCKGVLIHASSDTMQQGLPAEVVELQLQQGLVLRSSQPVLVQRPRPRFA